MQEQHGFDADFHVVEGNADLVADLVVGRVTTLASEMESQINRLYRGREAYDLGSRGRRDVERTIDQLRYMMQTLQEVRAAQTPIRYLQAAE